MMMMLMDGSNDDDNDNDDQEDVDDDDDGVKNADCDENDAVVDDYEKDNEWCCCVSE